MGSWCCKVLGDTAMVEQICSGSRYGADLAVKMESMAAMVVQCSYCNGGAPVCFVEMWQFPWLFAKDLW